MNAVLFAFSIIPDPLVVESDCPFAHWRPELDALRVHVIEVASRSELEKAIGLAKQAADDAGPIVIHVNTDPTVYAPDSRAWWDVPVSEVADLESTREAYGRYQGHQADQRPLIGPSQATEEPSPGAAVGDPSTLT